MLAPFESTHDALTLLPPGRTCRQFPWQTLAARIFRKLNLTIKDGSISMTRLHRILRTTTIALAIAGGLANFAPPVHGAELTQWRMATEYPASTMPGEGVSTFVKEVKSRTAGTLEILPSFDASAGVKSADMPAAVRDGSLDAGDAYGGALIRLNPVFALSSLPFVVDNIKDA